MDRGPVPTDQVTGVAVIFREYAEARHYLAQRLGWYCSYCERRLETHAAVEHVAPKSRHAARALDWTNFLLACVNCNSTKGAREAPSGAYLFPDEQNTAYAFVYGPGALIEANPVLTSDERQAATDTLALVGLDEGPPHSIHDPDRRWLRRQEVWGIAENQKDDLRRCDTTQMRSAIARLAIAEGLNPVRFSGQVFGVSYWADCSAARAVRQA